MTVGATLATECDVAVELVIVLRVALASFVKGELDEVHALAQKVIAHQLGAVTIAKIAVGLAETNQTVGGWGTDHPEFVGVVLKVQVGLLPSFGQMDVEKVQM